MAAVAVVAGYVVYATGVLGFFADAWRSLASIAGRAIGGVRDALLAGDLEAAMQVVWSGLKLIWAKGTSGLLAAWYGFRDSVVDTAKGVWTTLLKGGVAAIQGLQAAFTILAGVIGRTMLRASNSVALTWGKLRSKFDEDFDLAEYEAILTANLDADLRKSQANQEADLANIGATYEATINGLDAGRDEDRRRRDQERQANLDRLAAERVSAEQAFNDAIRNAAAAREASEADQAERPERPAFDPAALQKQMQGLFDRIRGGSEQARAGARQQDAVVGGFNPAAFDRLFAKSQQDRYPALTADAAAEAVRLMRRYMPLLGKTDAAFSA